MPRNFDNDEDLQLSASRAAQADDAYETQTPRLSLESESHQLTKSQAWNLYTTHFLSTWNARTYEFAAIIFTAAAYPDTLIATAVRGIVRLLASICFSPTVGRWVDSAPNRLNALINTILVNRFSVTAASVLWFFLLSLENEHDDNVDIRGCSGLSFCAILRAGMFFLILVLGILETLSASGNMLLMERDWVVTVSSTDGQPYDLTGLNAAMRRVDLICKLVAPVLLSVVVSATDTRTGVLTVGGMSGLSWAVEWWCAKRVWDLDPRLRAPKINAPHRPQNEAHSWSKFPPALRDYRRDVVNYFSTVVWVPSLSLAFLHFSALSYSATFITFLLNAGFSLDLITAARALGSVLEISSTIVTPIGVRYLSKAKNHGLSRGKKRLDIELITNLLKSDSNNADGTETGLQRLGLWGIVWQLINVIPVVFALYSLTSGMISSPLPLSPISPLTTSAYLAFILFFFLSISRLGLWIYDLTTQQLTQTMTPPAQRSSFTGVEYSFVAVFELGQNIFSVILHRPEQFKYIALMSCCAVGISTTAYSAWVWKMRGHLVHWERLHQAKCC